MQTSKAMQTKVMQIKSHFLQLFINWYENQTKRLIWLILK